MAAMTFHESYGTVSKRQLAAYRKYNVSPSDHDDLVRVYGSDNYAVITSAVVTHSRDGMFSPYLLAQSSLAFYD